MKRKRPRLTREVIRKLLEDSVKTAAEVHAQLRTIDCAGGPSWACPITSSRNA